MPTVEFDDPLLARIALAARERGYRVETVPYMRHYYKGNWKYRYRRLLINEWLVAVHQWARVTHSHQTLYIQGLLYGSCVAEAARHIVALAAQDEVVDLIIPSEDLQVLFKRPGMVKVSTYVRTDGSPGTTLDWWSYRDAWHHMQRTPEHTDRCLPNLEHHPLPSHT